ncbi:MAG: hypothetical protein HKN13_10265 [Rhodothermales bacterium]|nr:hypothetical protein [Rhodothermales bacterium]
MLNRGAIIVRPKQPYMDWATSLDDSGLVPDRNEERTVYLVPEYEDDDEAMAVLSRAYEMIFEEELNGWHTVVEDWPQNRTLATFLEWFDVEFHSIVDDLCGFPIIDDEAELEQ